MNVPVLLLLMICCQLGQMDNRLADPVLEHCIVSAPEDVDVPAEEAGVLGEVHVKEGVQVRQGDMLAGINDRQPQLEKKLAKIEQQAALEQAESEVNVRYAKAASLVAQAEYEQALEANQMVAGTFPAAEVRRLHLAGQRAYLEIEQAKLERRQAKFTADSREAQVELADETIDRRQLKAPCSGEIVKVLKRSGEWVNPGETVFRLVQFDTLRIEGFVDSAYFDPADVANRRVTVSVNLARGRTAQLEGELVYVSPVVQAGGEYRVWAEVTNQSKNGHWLLRPGMSVIMTVHLESAKGITRNGSEHAARPADLQP